MTRIIDKREQAIRTALAQNIRAELLRRGWSMTRLAREAGVSINAVNNACHGRHSPMLSTVDVICEALNITVTFAASE